MAIEEPSFTFGVGVGFTSRQSRHRLEHRRDVILGIVVALAASKTECRQILSDPGQRPLVQETCQIERRVRQQFAPPHTDEQVEVLATCGPGVRLPRGTRQRQMRHAEWRGVAGYARNLSKQLIAHRLPQKRGQQQVLARPKSADFARIAVAYGRMIGQSVHVSLAPCVAHRRTYSCASAQRKRFRAPFA